MRIKVKDTVEVLKGKDRGNRGTVLSIDRPKGRAVVEGVNLVKKHVRANPKQGVKGGILEREGAVPLSNLMVVCPRCGKPTRIGTEVLAADRKTRRVRRCRREGCGQQFDN